MTFNFEKSKFVYLSVKICVKRRDKLRADRHIVLRYYESQSIYSGLIYYGRDHNSSKHLLELHGGDIIYYDGTGIRDRYTAKKGGDMIKGYESPEGRFTELKKRMTGRSVIFILTAPSSFLMRYEYRAQTVPGGFGSSTIIGGRELDIETGEKEEIVASTLFLSPLLLFTRFCFIFLYDLFNFKVR